MNAYFQIVNVGNKCAVKLVPANNGGEPIVRAELIEYLRLKNIEYDTRVMGEALESLSTSPVIFPTTTSFVRAEGESVRVAVTPDNMNVIVRLIPEFQGGNKMPKNEFMREFSARGISYGIDEAAVDKFLEERPYCTNVVLAKGLPPVQGKDAKIEYFFNTDPKVKPTLNEDGSVDFFHLNTINHCKKGDLLAKLTPADLGQPGINVKNEKIRPREVKQAFLKFGHNIDINPEKTEIRSAVDGHVTFVGGKVFVSNVLEVENVDTAVGNIDYDGNVQVNGNVCENFSIFASGNVEVRGVVEGATIEAGGNIIIVRGMHGMHKGVLKSKGNIISKFLENADIQANGYVESESILYCNVTSGSEVKVTGKKGFIAGGRTVATSKVEVKNLGSNMGADTIIEVGMDANTKNEIQELQKKVVTLTKHLAQIKPVLEGAMQKIQSGIKMPQDQLLQIQKLAILNKEESEQLEESRNRLDELTAEIEEGNGEVKGQVIVTGDVYPGTKIVIEDVSMVVKGAMKYCRFIKEEGEVKMAAIY